MLNLQKLIEILISLQIIIVSTFIPLTVCAKISMLSYCTLSSADIMFNILIKHKSMQYTLIIAEKLE